MEEFAARLQHKVVSLIGSVATARVEAALRSLLLRQEVVLNVGRSSALIAFVFDEVNKIIALRAAVIRSVEQGAIRLWRNDHVGVRHWGKALCRTILRICHVVGGIGCIAKQFRAIGTCPVGIVRPVRITCSTSPYFILRYDDEVEQECTVASR